MNLEKLIEALENLEDNEYVTLTNPNIIFKEIEVEDGKVYKEIAIPKRLLKKIDFSNVSFDNVYICGLDFTRCIGVKIDPQTVYDKDFSFCVLSGVGFDGSFDGANISKTNFTGSKGAKINPQTIYNKNLSECKFSGVEFIGSFDRVIIEGADFTGSKGAKINFQTVNFDDLSLCVLTDAKIIDDIDMENIGTIKSRNSNDETGLIDANFKLMRKK